MPRAVSPLRTHPHCDGPAAFALRLLRSSLCAALIAALTGCGSTSQRTATEQLVLSDAVDRAVRNIDFSPIAGADCWLDTDNIEIGGSSRSSSRGGPVGKGYIVSSLRNQLAAAGCRLVEDRDDAEIVVEARVGTLGSDHHDLTYGFPSNNLVSQASILVPTAPAVPPLPEIAFAEKDDETAAAKLGIFAYDAKTGTAVWQSGIVTAQSSGRDTWILGIGPIQSGTIYEKPRFAGKRLRLTLMGSREQSADGQQVSMDQPFNFGPRQDAVIPEVDQTILPVSAEEESTP